MRMFNNNRGISLIEVIIGSAIIVFILTMFNSLISNVLNLGKMDNKLALLQQTKGALRLLSKEIREADNIRGTFDVNISSITFQIDNSTVTYLVTGEGKLIRQVTYRNNIPVSEPELRLVNSLKPPTAARRMFQAFAGNIIIRFSLAIGKIGSPNYSENQFEVRAANRNGGVI